MHKCMNVRIQLELVSSFGAKVCICTDVKLSYKLYDTTAVNPFILFIAGKPKQQQGS